MQPEQIFQFTSILALIGWIALILPSKKRAATFVNGIIILSLGLVYTSLIASAFRIENVNDFSRLDGVRSLFQNPVLLVAGWVHYLAFDLFVGIYIKKDAAENGIPHLFIIPCLLLTFLLGPVGLLLYWLERFLKRNVFTHTKKITS